MCNRQRISDWNNVRGCGCVGMDTNGSSLAIQHVISIETVDGGNEMYRMREFSSLKFSDLYLTGQIPGSVKLSSKLEWILQFVSCSRVLNIHYRTAPAHWGDPDRRPRSRSEVKVRGADLW